MRPQRASFQRTDGASEDEIGFYKGADYLGDKWERIASSLFQSNNADAAIAAHLKAAKIYLLAGEECYLLAASAYDNAGSIFEEQGKEAQASHCYFSAGYLARRSAFSIKRSEALEILPGEQVEMARNYFICALQTTPAEDKTRIDRIETVMYSLP